MIKDLMDQYGEELYEWLEQQEEESEDDLC